MSELNKAPLVLKSDFKSKIGSGATINAKTVDGSYLIPHSETGLPDDVAPVFLVMSEKNMAKIALAVQMAAATGILDVAAAAVESAYRRVAMKKAATEAAAVPEPDESTVGATDDLLKKLGLL